MSAPDFIFQFAEAVSAISLPIGGGLAAYARWRRGAERDKKAREDAARIASERAAKDARAEEKSVRDLLVTEYQDRIAKLNDKYESLRHENAGLHQYIIELLNASRRGSEGDHERN